MIVQTQYFSIAFDPLNGSILRFESGQKQFVGETLPLFSFRLRKGGQTTVFSSDEARKRKISIQKNRLSGSYAGFDGSDISFRVSACPSADGRALEWSLSFTNHTGMCVEWIDFPQLALPNDLRRSGGSGCILTNFNEGLLVDDMDMRQKTMPYREPGYPGHGMYGLFPAVVESQFLAYYDDEGGLYLGAHDPMRGMKGIDFLLTTAGAIKLQLRLYPGLAAAKVDYTLPFPIVFEVFKGDWQDAAEIYRDWFEANRPEGLQPICDDKHLPEWYTDSPLVVTYPVQGTHDMDTPLPNKLFPYENALDALTTITRQTGARIMALLMHWEGTAPWCPPYVWPPLGGEAALRRFAKALHAEGNLLGVYCSGLSYTLHSNLNEYSMSEEYEREGLERYMCAPPDGGEPLSDICQCIRKSLDMCISQPFTKKVIADEVKKIQSSGVDYIQVLDQNHGGTPYFCYSDAHSHPPVPGAWMVEHMTELLVQLTDADKSPVFGCESAAAEAYIPYLKLSDNRFNLNYGPGQPVPLYSYLYHEYLSNFSGNSVCSMDILDVHRSPDCHLMRIAYSFVNGDLMTLVMTQEGEIAWSWGERDFSVLPERAPMMHFIRQATRLRSGIGKRYLVGARRVKDIPILCEKVKMYKTHFPDYETQYPAVLSATYRFEQTFGQVLGNYTHKEVTCRRVLPRNGILYDADGKLLQELSSGEAEFVMPACSVALLVWQK